SDRGLVREVWPVAASAGCAHARVNLRDAVVLGERLASTAWFILAQVHSHPRGAFHSSVDDAYPISHQPGFLSVVVPDFGVRAPLQGWAYYEYCGVGAWRPIEGDELRLRVRVPEQEAWWRSFWNAITA